jgi:hypothetical protein
MQEGGMIETAVDKIRIAWLYFHMIQWNKMNSTVGVTRLVFEKSLKLREGVGIIFQ